jgi:putative addiction module component (TIGR02574 family)
MSTSLERLAIELLGLPASERALLAKQLIDSLEENRAQETEDRWLQTAQRRSREMAEGKVEGRPAEEVFRAAKERLQ